MPTLVVPFRGTGGKSRLEPLADAVREAVAHAMLADVLAAAAAVGPTFLVAPEAAASATHVADPHRGQGAAVAAALDAAVGVGAAPPFVVVNADLPCARPRDLLALASADLFRPLYGPGSAERFAGLGPSQRVDAPNLVDDVDTIDDLARLEPRLGPQTRRAFASLRRRAA